MKINIKRVFDPLYGLIELSDEEYSIVMSPELQRLRYVRMCNINSLLVTGASEISRFEHIIGVLKLAKEWTQSNSSLLNDLQKKDIHAAALLHDFQTGPFGHSLQYVFEDNSSSQFVHDDIHHGSNLKFHQTTDANRTFSGYPFICEKILGKRWFDIASLIKGEGKFGKIISGTIDLDNIDNVIRLAYHVGVAKSADAAIAIELARDMKSTPDGIEISESSVELVMKWQSIRRRLYELLLLDWAEFSSKAMLTRALELAVDHKLLGTDSWLLTDLDLFNTLEKLSTGAAQEIGYLIKKIRCGDLFHPIFLGSSPSIETYSTFSNIKTKRVFERELIREIKEKLKVNVILIIHPILDLKKTDRSINVSIREYSTEKTIGINSKQLLLGVFISKEILSDVKCRNAKNLIVEFLERKGLKNLQHISDPMIKPQTQQLELF